MDEISKILKQNENLIEALKNLNEKLAGIEPGLIMRENNKLKNQVKNGLDKQSVIIEEKIFEMNTSAE